LEKHQQQDQRLAQRAQAQAYQLMATLLTQKPRKRSIRAKAILQQNGKIIARVDSIETYPTLSVLHGRLINDSDQEIEVEALRLSSPHTQHYAVERQKVAAGASTRYHLVTDAPDVQDGATLNLRVSQMAMLKIVLLILCFIWRPSWAEGQSIEQYKKTLRAGQQELDTRQALLHEHEIHTLIPEVLEAALQAENQKEAKDQQERQDQQKPRTESASQTPRDERQLNPSAALQAAHIAPEAPTATTASASQTEKPNATLDAWLQRRTLDIDDTLSVAPRLTPPQ
ncbi:MAG: hypothetical protein P8104_02130, partial [Gammaproteobacteria bacterium]